MPPARKFMLCSGECVPIEKLDDYPDSHIIGELGYVADEGHRVTALSLYEISSQWPQYYSTIRVKLIGDAREIRCTRCENKIRWEAGKAAMDAIVARARQNGA